MCIKRAKVSMNDLVLHYALRQCYMFIINCIDIKVPAMLSVHAYAAVWAGKDWDALHSLCTTLSNLESCCSFHFTKASNKQKC